MDHGAQETGFRAQSVPRQNRAESLVDPDLMHHPNREPTLSIRVIWPFARMMSLEPRFNELREILGISLAELADRDTRISASATMRALAHLVEILGDPTVGLKAGIQVDQGDFDVLEYAARSAPNFGEAIRTMMRYLRVMNDAAEPALEVHGELAYWRYQPGFNLVYPPATNDFIVASGLSFSRRNCVVYVPPLEVHVMHERTDYASAYETYLECPVVFGASHNAVVIHKSRLEQPMQRANPTFGAVFEAEANRALERLKQRDDVSHRVRQHVAAQLSRGDVSMQATARAMAMGVATLRRRLEEEGASYSDIVDDLRKQLSQRYLRQTDPSVSEVAFMLGFSDVRAFGRAFKRWYGLSPTEYRSQA